MDRPVFIIGSGRNGSTLLHEMLSRHEEVSWLSSLCDRYPDDPSRNRWLLRAVSLPGVGRLLWRRFPPDECYSFWNRSFPGFATPCRDLTAEDVSPVSRERIRAATWSATLPSRPRLVVKLTGWPRARFLNEIFEDALFVHLVRDGRAVANSLLQVGWWRGWGGPGQWRFGPLSREDAELWEESGRSFVVLAGLQWRRLMEAARVCEERIADSRWLEVRYESLCDRPVESVDRILAFAGLSESRSVARTVGSRQIVSRNRRWREELSGGQQDALERVLRPELDRLGYR